MTLKTGKFLTFGFDCEYEDQSGNYIPEGTQAEVANVYKQIEGFTPVIVNSVIDWSTNEEIQIPTDVCYYMNSSFKELN